LITWPTGIYILFCTYRITGTGNFCGCPFLRVRVSCGWDKSAKIAIAKYLHVCMHEMIDIHVDVIQQGTVQSQYNLILFLYQIAKKSSRRQSPLYYTLTIHVLLGGGGSNVHTCISWWPYTCFIFIYYIHNTSTKSKSFWLFNHVNNSSIYAPVPRNHLCKYL
jgi:hypothetical protein